MHYRSHRPATEDDPGGHQLASYFQSARKRKDLAVLEGFHAVKHALRFEADIDQLVACDREELDRLVSALAPDIKDSIGAKTQLVTERTFSSLGPHTPYTRVMALAIRPAIDIAAVLGHPGPEPVVLLQDPRDLGNLGAAVRVAAAASCAGVVTTGLHDPWSPPALRGSCGLHYAVPVGQAESLPACSRPLVAIDPSGSPFDPAALPERSVVTFGTERYGLTAELLQRADYTFKVPMQEGVSSLNLATCVAAVLFAWRLFHSTS